MRKNIDRIPRPLRRSWWWAVVGYGFGLIGMFVWLLFTPWGERYAVRWLGLATMTACLVLGILYTHLGENRRLAEMAVLPTLGWGNGLTVMRGLLLAMLAGFLFSPWPLGALGWLPAILGLGADLLDAIDGYVARLADQQTKLGEILDVENDALGAALIVSLAVWYGQLPWGYLSIALARYLFVAGLWWQQRRNQAVYELSPSRYRRMLGGYQMGFLAVALWPIVTPSFAALAGSVFILPVLVLFGRDWLVVSGRLDATTLNYQQWRRQAQTLFINRLPLLWRLVLLLTAVTTGMLLFVWRGAPSWVALFQMWGWPTPVAIQVAQITAVVSAVLIVAVVLGIQARWCAIFLVWGVSVNYIADPRPDSALLTVSVLVLTLTNSGNLSLWKPDDNYMYVPLGVSEKAP